MFVFRHHAMTALFVAAVCSPVTNSATAQSLTNSETASPNRYVFLLFTSQSVPKVPRHSHTWGVMVRLGNCGIAEVSTISWMPADMRVEPWRFTTKPGVNLHYLATYRFVVNDCQRVTVWGPYEANAELYQRFHGQRLRLMSGEIGYQAIDCIGEAALEQRGGNCMHALKPLHGAALGDALQCYGDASGTYICRTMLREGLLCPHDTANDWIIDALGLGNQLLRRPD